jgi:tetrahydromethanopterin S-methyltransferase subunit G
MAHMVDDLPRRLGELEDVEKRLGELDEIHRRLAEVEERLDFTERLLAKQREADRVAPPKS